MTELYLVRHAQAEGNLYKMMQGHWDGGITKQGKAETAALGERFRSVKLDAIYSSDLYRARYTASGILSRHPELTLRTDPRLREINVGVWECTYFADRMYKEPELMQLFTSFSDSWAVEGSETFPQVGDRAMQAMEEICLGSSDKAVAVVSHGITIKCLLARITGIPLSDSERLPICENTGVTKLIYDNGHFTMEYFNNRDHLPGFPRWNGKLPCFRGESFNPAEDPDRYISCYASAWRCAHGSLKGFDPEAYLNSAVSHYKADPRSVMMLYDGDKPAGLIDIDCQRSAGIGAAWLSLIYLEEEYRSWGLGIQLLGRVYMYAESIGRKSVRLNVAADNKVARSFYEKWGFREIGRNSTGLGSLLLLEKTLGEKETIV